MNINKSAPMLSIIVPVYNAEKTIDRCISFILNQNFTDYEVIFVNDCSTDNSEEIIKKYQILQPQKIICYKTNYQGGPGHARNCGMQVATGRYIGFIDADDWVDSSLYSIVIKNILKEDADVAIFGVKDEYENRMSTTVRYNYKYLHCIDNKFAVNLLCRTYNNDIFISPMVCQKVYKSAFLKENDLKFKENSYYEDDLFSFQLFLHKCKTIIIPDCFYHYYQRPNSITHSFSKKHIDDLIDFFCESKKYLYERDLWQQYNTQFYAMCQKCLINTMNLLFCIEADVATQKQYVKYTFKQLQSYLNVEEWIDFLDIQSIRRLF